MKPLAPSVVTTAINCPVAAGGVLNVTVSEVAVAAVTVPTGVVEPSVNVTVSLPAVGSKPWPLMVSVVASAARLAVLLVTTGVGVATCTGAAARAIGRNHRGQRAGTGGRGGEDAR